MTQKFFSVNDVLSQIEIDDDIRSADIFICPPGDGTQSDEDDANEDMQQNVNPNQLPGRQLASEGSSRVVFNDGSKGIIGDVTPPIGSEEAQTSQIPVHEPIMSAPPGVTPSTVTTTAPEVAPSTVTTTAAQIPSSTATRSRLKRKIIKKKILLL